MDEKFENMKKMLGEEAYDTLNIVSGTLLYQTIHFMKKLGLLEEFLKDKNKISRFLVERILKMEEIK